MKHMLRNPVIFATLLALGCTKRVSNASEPQGLLEDTCYAPQKEVTPNDQDNWVKMMIPAAQDAERIYGAPAAGIIAMSSRESGFGNTLIYLNAFNAFGFKWTSSEAAEGRGYYALWCQPKADPNNKYIKFKNYWDGALFVGKKLAMLSRYKPTTDRYVQDRQNGVEVKTAVDRWIAGVAYAGYNYDPPTYTSHITQTANNYQQPGWTRSASYNLYWVSGAVRPRDPAANSPSQNVVDLD